MGKEDKHFVLDDKTGRHKTESGPDDGACLSSHESTYRESNSCSYRWQAVKISLAERTDVYNLSAEELGRRSQDLPASAFKSKGLLVTSAYVTKAGGQMPPKVHYDAKRGLPVPKAPGDWHLGGPTRSGVEDAVGNPVAPGHNFKHFTVPYWNNAHHIIPKGLFNALVDHEDTPAKVRTLLRRSLLQATYNINHAKNVIILPMDRSVARLLRLPRHLTLEDETPIREEKPKFDHITYTTNVEEQLAPIINRYKTKCDEAVRENCDAGEVTLEKEQLEDLSEHLYRVIVEFGTQNTEGHPLAAIPRHMFEPPDTESP